MPFPITAEEQYGFALKVACPWHKCGAKVGEKCTALFPFPQYPHTSRLAAGFKLAGFEEGIKAMDELEEQSSKPCTCTSCIARAEQNATPL